MYISVLHLEDESNKDLKQTCLVFVKVLSHPAHLDGQLVEVWQLEMFHPHPRGFFSSKMWMESPRYLNTSVWVWLKADVPQGFYWSETCYLTR